ncbi:MAG: alcohol dehydrogenase [Gemmatimonadales bacterium]|nr:MAG: alcohol dehydrogenase [Gemmatimonadales bacterium]
MNALTFDVSARGFIVARAMGRFTEAATFGPLSALRLSERAPPVLPGPEWVELEVLACGICGTDLATLRYTASPALEPFGSFPAVPGHEILARVLRVGAGVEGLEEGERVAVDPMLSCRVRGRSEDTQCASCSEGRHSTCELAGEEGVTEVAGKPLSPGMTIGYHRDLPGGWGERMVAHRSQLFPVSPRLSDRAAVLLEPLSIGMHAVLNAPPQDPGADVLVIGSGPIAMAVTWALRANGFQGAILAQVKRSHEAELARALGASDAVQPGLEVRELLAETGSLAYQPILGPEVFSGGGFPLVYDCVGSAASLTQALRYTAPRGRVVMLGCAAQIPKLDLTFLWARELEVRGFVGYGEEEWRGERLHTFDVTQQLLLETEAPVAAMVTHAYPLREYRDALSAAANRRRSGALKVILEPGR